MVTNDRKIAYLGGKNAFLLCEAITGCPKGSYQRENPSSELKAFSIASSEADHKCQSNIEVNNCHQCHWKGIWALNSACRLRSFIKYLYRRVVRLA